LRANYLKIQEFTNLNTQAYEKGPKQIRIPKNQILYPFTMFMNYEKILFFVNFFQSAENFLKPNFPQEICQ